MKVQIDTNAAEFTAALNRWAAHFGKTVPEAVRKEAAQIARWLSSAPKWIRPGTPPETKSQGTKRVRDDIRRTYNPLTEAYLTAAFQDEKLRAKVSRYVRDRKTEGLRAIFANLGRKEYRDFGPEQHRQARDSRGRVNRSSPFVTADVQEVAAYSRRKEANVGMARGAWVPFLLHLGRSAPAWLTRHAMQGSFTDDTARSANPSVTLTNRSPWAGYRDETNRVTANVLRGRAFALAKAIETSLARAEQRRLAA